MCPLQTSIVSLIYRLEPADIPVFNPPLTYEFKFETRFLPLHY
jgi:hypothetical protein